MIYRNYRYIAFALTLLTTFSLAYARPKTVQNTVIDDLGNTHFTIQKKAPRIASVSIFGAELTLALGFHPVAMSTYPGGIPDYLPELKYTDQLGPRSQTNFEALYRSKPDIVIGLRRMVEPHSKRYEEISPTVGFDLITLGDSFEAVQKSSDLIGQHEQGKQINKCFVNSLQTMKEKIGNKSLSGVFLTSAGITPRAYYSHYMTVGLMNELNIKNVAGASPYSSKMPFSGQVGLEWLVKLNPDIIFMYEGSEAQYTKTNVWDSLSAVKNNRVYKVGGHWREPEGPYSRIWVSMDIAHKAYPDLFSAPTLHKLNRALLC
ncbi:ABC transporter substrate-binding protein [Vibrio sp. HN007]|uniref:ABC transporter substrate-binding protein n=1 Tax=Vibrio iocasae TaxID=3098914 RepID=UPI0035D406BB